MKEQLLAIVADARVERIYLPPDQTHEMLAARANPSWIPDTELSTHPQYMGAPRYGMIKHADLFTARQLVALTTFSDLVGEVHKRVRTDALAAGMSGDRGKPSNTSKSAQAYSDAIATYLAFCVDKNTLTNCTQATWQINPDRLRQAFARQALPMTWDYAEANPFSQAGGDFALTVQSLTEVMAKFPSSEESKGLARQLDAAVVVNGEMHSLISTDPPYYDNVPYADLSDFFYVWLRRSLGSIYPDLFETLLTPKAQKLVADQFRHRNREKAQRFFEEGLGSIFSRMREVQHPDYPLTIFYAFKQSETEENKDGSSDDSLTVASTGWQTMLEGLLKSGFTITGTWPMRTELGNRARGMGSNALASSIVLVCRPRSPSAPLATRREFLTALKRELPDALKMLQHGNIAPVDLAQAAIGPGMAVFSRHAKVLEADGTPMRVRTALALINQALDEVLAEQEGEFDTDTRWALAWFEQHGFEEGLFGTAETLSKAKNTAVSSMVEAGILSAKAGKVRLLRRDELPSDWDPTKDGRLTAWETTQHLIRVLEKGGESGAAQLLAKLGSMGELARDLAYRLYTTCERKKWAQDALAFNTLVVSWPEIIRLVGQKPGQRQEEMF